MTPQLAPVILSEHNPSWVQMYEGEKEKILQAIGEHVIAIEHIGSTVIPGAIAKPEIDIMILVKNFTDALQFIAALESMGYVYFKRFEEVVPERRYLRKSEGIVPLFHIHILDKEEGFWNDRLLFKQYLCGHPEAVAFYNKAKKRLAEEFREDRKQYSAQKDAVVEEILALARV